MDNFVLETRPESESLEHLMPFERVLFKRFGLKEAN